MKTKLLLIIISFNLAGGVLNAQILNTWNLYNQDGYLINPAFSGNNGKINAYLNSRRSIVDVEGAPKTISFGLHSPFMKKMGLGLKILSDRRGLLETSTGMLSYAYRLQLDENNQSLTFGVSGGILKQDLNKASLVTDNLADPTLNSNSFDKISFEGDAGLLYQNRNLFVSISAPHVFQFYQQFIALAGYKFEFPSAGVSLTPSVLFQTLPGEKSQFDIGLTGTYKNKLWASGLYRSNKNVVMSLGFNFETLGFGYAYEMNNSNLSHISKSNHELMVTFRFGAKKKTEPETKIEKVAPPPVDIPVKNAEQEKVEQELRERIKLLERNIELERQINSLKDSLNTRKQGNSASADMLSSEVQNIQYDDLLSSDINLKTSKLIPGNYVVIATLTDGAEAATRVKKIYDEKKIKASVAHDQAKGYFYIYTGMSEDLGKATEMLKEEKNRGFTDAWICIFK